MDNSFDLLEEKVRKAADLVTRLRKDNLALGEDLKKAKGRLQEAEKRLDSLEKARASSSEDQKALEALQREAGAYRKEREEIRSRVAKLLEVLEGLD